MAQAAQVARGHKAHVSKAKKAEVEGLVKLLTGSEVVGLVNIQGIPASSMLQMRRTLRAEATMKVAKNTLLRLALAEAAQQKPGLDQLIAKIDGPTCIITTRMNPFRLYRKLDESKTKAPARGGEKAPEDIWIRKGETPFKPGPVVGELQRSGSPAAIDEGKVVIKSDKLLVKAGDTIPANIAAGLTRLEIFPLTIGLDVKAVYEGGMVYGPDVLGIDQKKILEQIGQGARAALNLSVNTAFPTKQTVPHILAKAQREAIALALDAAIADTGGAMDALLAKANAEMVAVARRLQAEALDPDLMKKIT
jgi:large subunit ribosomal protein L10